MVLRVRGKLSKLISTLIILDNGSLVVMDHAVVLACCANDTGPTLYIVCDSSAGPIESQDTCCVNPVLRTVQNVLHWSWYIQRCYHVHLAQALCKPTPITTELLDRCCTRHVVSLDVRWNSEGVARCMFRSHCCLMQLLTLLCNCPHVTSCIVGSPCHVIVTVTSLQARLCD